MILWIFAILTVVAALLVAVSRTLRVSILALWVTGILLGALFLTQGAELLAVTQWICITLVCGVLVFFSLMFGEFNPRTREGLSSQERYKAGAAIAVSLMFGVLVEMGLRSSRSSTPLLPETGQDLTNLGTLMIQHHFLSLLVLAVSLLLTLIGIGVITRPDPEEKV